MHSPHSHTPWSLQTGLVPPEILRSKHIKLYSRDWGSKKAFTVKENILRRLQNGHFSVPQLLSICKFC